MGLDNPIHIAFLLILLLLVFGAKRLPEMGRSLGDGMRGFKDALGGESGTAAARTAAEPALYATQQPLAAPAIEVVPVPVQTPAPAQEVPAVQPAREKLTA